MENPSDQLDRQKRSVSYDMYDITVRQLVDMVSGKEIDVAPEYQRHFVWDDDRESELIESVFLGIPVPSLYMATNNDGSWEVVDGVQRLSTLVHFCGGREQLDRIGKTRPLKLKNLKKLTAFNGKVFEDLPKSVQLNFTLRPVRVTTLNDKSDASVRYDLFERLNTGGVRLHPQEIRNCVFQGKFRNLILRLTENENYRAVVSIPSNEQQRAILEECILRFFAFYENYENFDHSVVDFLSDYMAANMDTGPNAGSIELFEETMSTLRQNLPRGIARGNRGSTPLNLYEAIAVGTAQAIASGQQVHFDRLPALLEDDRIKSLTTGATNSKKMVKGRIEAVRDELLR